MPRHCYVLRVFTDGDRGGNHLGVVTDVTGIDTAGMQSIAADLGFSETVFADWNDRDVPHVRIFTPGREIPFAGHPLVGAAWVYSMMAPGRLDRLTCEACEVGFRTDGEVVWVDVPALGEVTGAPDGGAVAGRCGLPEPIGAWWVAMPLPYLLLEAPDAATVSGADPDFDRLGEHFGTLLFARDGEHVRARFFAPAAAVPEDPATGSAAVALAAVLRHRGEAEGAVEISQGSEIGHPSRIRLRWSGYRVSIGGTVARDEVRFLDP
jgi:trans-2,3-dihydro-3-hydroxyanthranilate isomerase